MSPCVLSHDVGHPGCMDQPTAYRPSSSMTTNVRHFVWHSLVKCFADRAVHTYWQGEYLVKFGTAESWKFLLDVVSLAVTP